MSWFEISKICPLSEKNNRKIQTARVAILTLYSMTTRARGVVRVGKERRKGPSSGGQPRNDIDDNC